MGKHTHIFVIALILTLAAIATTGVASEFIKANVTIGHGPNKPSSVPILPCLNAGRSMFFGPIPSPARQGDYEPIDGGYFKHNGDGAFNYIITSGAWLLKAGDKPRISITLRPARGGYASPVILPGPGVEGQLRPAVRAGGQTKWLDQFDSIDTFLSPGSVGKMVNLRGPLMNREKPNLGVSDIVLDTSREVHNIELRCVASETILGIMGITVLQAR
ncbi:MAG: hypothetical protein ACYTEL_07810 [Planctomycetota bacterium]